MSKIKSMIGLCCLTAIALAGCASNSNDPVALAQEREARIKRCQELKREIDSLKGQPVRRSAAMDYYQSECFRPGETNPIQN